METPIDAYRISYDTRALGSKGTLQMRFGGRPDEIISGLEAAQLAAVAVILNGASPNYDPATQTVSSIRIIQVENPDAIGGVLAGIDNSTPNVGGGGENA